MFSLGDTVIYGEQGVCKIDGIEAKQVGNKKVDYYVLKPVFSENTAVFVPVDNCILTAKMQRVLNAQQAKSLIKGVSQIDALKFDNDNQKRERYKNIITSGDRQALVAFIKAIYLERNIRHQNGKRLNMSDEQTLYKAERLLFNEIAYALGIDLQEAQEMIKF